MSTDPTLELLRKLWLLLEQPHPGLSTWQIARAEAALALRDHLTKMLGGTDASYERGRAAMAAEVRELTKPAGTGALLSAERGKALGYSSGHDEKVADEFRAHLLVLRAFLNTVEGAD